MTRDDKMMAFLIMVFVVALLLIAFISGIRVAAGVSCRDLGYETGIYAGPIWDASIVCSYEVEVPIPSMWVGP